MLILCHILYSLKENVLGFLSLCKWSILEGVSVSVFFSWPLIMEFTIICLAILEISFLEVFFKRMAFSVNFLWDILGTIFLYYLLMESVLVPCCISDGKIWVLCCRCFAFFEAASASESASSFSSIPWWARPYTNLMFCTFGLMSRMFSRIALTVELWQFFSVLRCYIASIADEQLENISRLSFEGDVACSVVICIASNSPW